VQQHEAGIGAFFLRPEPQTLDLRVFGNPRDGVRIGHGVRHGGDRDPAGETDRVDADLVEGEWWNWDLPETTVRLETLRVARLA